jgi:hypothetical protein
MTSAEILEWVMGWAWPIIFVFVVLIVGGIERLITWDKQGLSEDLSSSLIPDKECLCQCE